MNATIATRKWVRYERGNMIKLKFRTGARDFGQIYNVNCSRMFAPTPVAVVSEKGCFCGN